MERSTKKTTTLFTFYQPVFFSPEPPLVLTTVKRLPAGPPATIQRSKVNHPVGSIINTYVCMCTYYFDLETGNHKNGC